MIEALIRPLIRQLKPYTSARDLYQQGLFLDANENPFGSVAGKGLNRYPDPYSKELKKALSRFLNVSADSLFVGVGSDEVIGLIIKLFVEPQEAIMIFEPTYDLYRVAAKSWGVQVVNCPLDSSFQIDLDKAFETLTPQVKLIFCCSPNSPTGNLMNSQTILELCRRFKGIVVVDEAYIEFASRPSLVPMVDQFPNLIILRTFSKAWGLAGARVGYSVSSPEVVKYLNKIKPPYPLNVLSSIVAVQALSRTKRMLVWRQKILVEREKLFKELKTLGLTVTPSETNFLLVQCPEVPGVVPVLAERFGVIVRDFGFKSSIPNSFRLTVGTPRQNRLFLKAISQLL